jgi:hypothetical protein
MGWVQEILDLFKQLQFCDIVYEYEQGLFYGRKGYAIPRKVRRTPKELEKIVAEEERVTEELGGRTKLMLRLKNPEMPEGYGRQRILGLPRSEERNEQDRILRPGLYFFWPIAQQIIKRSQQETVLNLGNITVLTSDFKNLTLSCNVRYRLEDLYKAFTAVHDYEVSLKDHTLSILALHARGNDFKYWTDAANIGDVEKKTTEELEKVVKKKWGLDIVRLYITDVAQTYLQRILYEGQPPFADTGGRVGNKIPTVPTD